MHVKKFTSMLSRSALRSRLLQYMVELRDQEQYDEEEGYHYWSDANNRRTMSGTCTNGAQRIAREFGGRVAGYHTQSDDGRVGAIAGGHDFAIVDDFLIRLYGSPETWEEIS